VELSLRGRRRRPGASAGEGWVVHSENESCGREGRPAACTDRSRREGSPLSEGVGARPAPVSEDLWQERD
jgi:hypothetical protein